MIYAKRKKNLFVHQSINAISSGVIELRLLKGLDCFLFTNLHMHISLLDCHYSRFHPCVMDGFVFLITFNAD